MSQLDEFLEARHGFAGPDRFPGKLNSVAQARGFSAHDKAGGGIQKHDIPARALPVGKNFPYDCGILSGIPALNGADGGARNAEIFGRHVVGADFSAPHFGDLAFSADGDLIQPVGTVNDEGAFRSRVRRAPGPLLR